MRFTPCIGFLFLMLSTILPAKATASTGIDLLELPARASKLVAQSVVMATLLPHQPLKQSNKRSLLALGERGHIFSWQDDNAWQQHQVPVSVTLTGITQLSTGASVAVGHQSVILTKQANSTQWVKVFDGHQLITLQINALEQQIRALQLKLTTIADPDLHEELSYQLEDLAFALADIVTKQAQGSQNPLLSVTRTAQDILFAAGAYGILLSSKDQGVSWQLISDRLANPEQFHLNQVVVGHNDRLYLIGENGVGFKSADLGVTWHTMSLPYGGSLFGIITIDDSSLVAFGLQGNLLLSSDQGETWHHHKFNTSASLLGGMYANQRVYLVGHGGLVVDFSFDDFAQPVYRRHPSGATFSSVGQLNNQLVLAGQLGIHSWSLK